MTDSFIGIDLGTSSVKVLKTDREGHCEKVRRGYESNTPGSWLTAVRDALADIDKTDVRAIGLSSQVGTYIVNEQDVYSWSGQEGSVELTELLSRYPKEVFIRELGMAHPMTISYPLPRLLYFRKKYGDALHTVCQPKELMCRYLTGRYVSDYFSFRGLANRETCAYSDFFLREEGFNRDMLPPLISPTSLAGNILPNVARETGLPEGLPVYVGMNDFYCSLLGMGVQHPGDVFDITGTSEHLGRMEALRNPNTLQGSTPYLDGFIHYGVTAGSGRSLRFASDLFGTLTPDADRCMAHAPIFLPYLDGERAPIFDSNAQGVFFGIRSDTTKEQMAYAVCEGVAFSIAHIADCMKLPGGGTITVSGGAAENPLLCTLKATLLNRDYLIPEQIDTSALGAAILAACGSGAFPDFAAATKSLCHVKDRVSPNSLWREKLTKRFSVYLSLYPTLKQSFRTFKEIEA